MDLGIERRTALVMGASRGIGRGIAEVLAREGAAVALASRSLEALEAVAETLPTETACFAVDSGDLEALVELPAAVAAALGPVEILIVNTGGPPAGGVLENSQEQWEAAYRELVLAPKALVERTVEGMRNRGWGRIVNVASSSVREPIPGLALSTAHRMATVGLFKTLSAEVAADGVTVNTIGTGRIATDRLADLYGSIEVAEEAAAEEVPAGRLGTPEEYGDLVAFICSDRAAYLTGAVIPLDGGLLRSA